MLLVSPSPPGQVLRTIRLSVMLSFMLLLLLFLQRRYALVSKFFAERSSSTNLAVARIANMVAILWEVHYLHLARFAALDHVLLRPFLGWGRLALRLPLSPAVVRHVSAVFVVVAICALVGFWTRISCAITGLCGLYLLCIPQLTGKIDHDYGHLAVFAFILALAPSGDALSVDAFLAGRQIGDRGLWLRPRYARVYATALQAMMLYFSAAYFFPGLWKVAGSGGDWFRPSHMRYMIAERWDGVGMDRLQLWFLAHPALLFAGAAVTIAFELGFVFAVLSPRTRPYLIAVGLGFHNLTYLLMGIHFAAVQMLYVILFDWSPLFTRLAARHEAGQVSATPGRSSWALRLFCAAALGGMVLTGAEHKMTSWPIACYPTFDWAQPSTLEIRTLDAVDIYGEPHHWQLTMDPVMRDEFGRDRWNVLVWYNFGGPPGNVARTQAAVNLWLKYHPSAPILRGEIVSSFYLRNESMKNMPLVSQTKLVDFDLRGP